MSNRKVENSMLDADRTFYVKVVSLRNHASIRRGKRILLFRFVLQLERGSTNQIARAAQGHAGLPFPLLNQCKL